MKSDVIFRHDSLQNRKTVKSLLDALTKGIGKGHLVLDDGEDEVTLEPDGLLTLRIRADRTDSACRLEFRISWSESPAASDKKKPPEIR